ncbi:MAG: energy-coupling factor ABC transporter ATP-binding protein [Oscillospiraceae bacterium]|jgi:energy-coupling factor transport system ATP-binding protein|nr:energy-coupling factor ABC transporter ATP-binding protein [Oscillospiraceae bacterium]
MIQASGLAFRYEGAAENTLQGIDLRIAPGAFVGLAGASGSGKTTLLYALCGVIPHFLPGDFYGHVAIDGLDTIDTKPAQLARHVGLVMQDTDSQFATTIVEDEIRFGLENFGFSDIEGRVARVLQMLGIESLRTRALRSLSGGQKRKAAIASILALEPACLLLDEPTGELDPPSKRQVYEALRALSGRGIAILVAEKNRALLDEFCQSIITLEGGHVSV